MWSASQAEFGQSFGLQAVNQVVPASTHLLLERVDMVGIHMGIAQHVHKVARPQPAHLHAERAGKGKGCPSRWFGAWQGCQAAGTRAVGRAHGRHRCLACWAGARTAVITPAARACASTQVGSKQLDMRLPCRCSAPWHSPGDPRCPHLRHHAGQQRVAGDVEGHAQAQVTRPLVHLARQLAVRHVKLRRGRHTFLWVAWSGAWGAHLDGMASGQAHHRNREP